jgi:uroporphyrinogen decarboxylase
VTKSPIAHPFIEACNRRPVPHVPLWIMRQAGRYMPQYQAVRGKVDFLTLCRTPELATKVTLLPIELLKVDAAILFSDILIPLEPMGVHVAFAEGEGPVLTPPVRSEKDIRALRSFRPEEGVPFVMEAVRMIRRELDGKVPLIGFSGAPFTLATYMTEGGTSKSFHHIKTLLFARPELADLLLDKLATVVADYLNAQIAAGAQAVQLFDTWGGILAGADYERFALSPVKKVIARLDRKDLPVIYYLNNGAYLASFVEGIDCDVYGMDWRQDIALARRTIGRKKAIQGNMDPVVLFADAKTVQAKAREILRAAGPEPGYIFNLGHGILPQTPMENAVALVEAVHSFQY